jgi:hypothetical protein
MNDSGTDQKSVQRRSKGKAPSISLKLKTLEIFDSVIQDHGRFLGSLILIERVASSFTVICPVIMGIDIRRSPTCTMHTSRSNPN